MYKYSVKEKKLKAVFKNLKEKKSWESFTKQSYINNHIRFSKQN